MDRLKLNSYWILFLIATFMMSCNSNTKKEETTEKLKAVIIDGSNNHYIWPKTTQMVKSYLEETGLFEVKVERLDTIWIGHRYNPNREREHEYYINEYKLGDKERTVSMEPLSTTNFEVDLSDVDLVVINIGNESPSLSQSMQASLENFMKNGGGMVVYHSGNNAWGDWNEYNKMIGVGAWGGRNGETGPFVYMDDEGNVQKETTGDQCGQHGMEFEYPIDVRESSHPIMKGLPTTWMHTKDELYDFMRGPFENATILATAFSDKEINRQSWEPYPDGSGQHVPLLLAINYGDGRVFHTALGHFDYSLECVGFITTLQRGAEWAATGKVTQEIPSDFPTATESSARNWTAK